MMTRIFLVICVLALRPLLAQPQGAGPGEQAPPRAQTTQTSAPVAGGTGPQLPVQPAAPVAPDAAVITIHGLCPAGQAKVQQSDSCTMVLTRAQFETMVSSINITNQAYTLPALRNIGSGYVTVLALADAGEKAGIDKDPRFQEFMKVAHTRALADAYRRYLQEKYGNPTAEEIAEYYKQNASKFELTKIERVLIPKVNPLRSQDKPAEFEKKARELSTALHERAARGEDMSALQVEAYKTLGVQAMPPQTEISPNQKGAIQPAVQQEINALKPGEVTKVEFEPSGFNIYKLRSRTTIPLEQAKADIVKELSQKNIDAALKAATGHVHSEFNEQFFNPGPAVAPPNHRVPLRMRTPASAPTSGTVAPAVPPVASGSPAPPASSSSPVPQKPAPPK